MARLGESRLVVDLALAGRFAYRNSQFDEIRINRSVDAFICTVSGVLVGFNNQQNTLLESRRHLAC